MTSRVVLLSLLVVVQAYQLVNADCMYNKAEYKIGDKFKSMDDCNDCVCGPLGVVCTTKLCQGKPSVMPSTGSCTVTNGGVTKTYKDGDAFTSDDGCNVCLCKSGKPSCTEIYCGKQMCTDSSTGKTYAAGESFKSSDGCNTCNCISGGKIACTLMACLQPKGECTDKDTGEMYKEGESFKASDGCNMCQCMKGAIACTEMACKQPADCFEPYLQSFYKDGESYKAPDGCNTCKCSQGKITCTKINCISVG